jgi:hypothetical protein
MKKGMSQMWWIIATAVLVILVVVLLTIWFKGSGESGFDAIDNQIKGFGDSDGDKVADFNDDCPCDPNLQEVEDKSSCNPKPDCKI